MVGVPTLPHSVATPNTNRKRRRAALAEMRRVDILTGCTLDYSHSPFALNRYMQRPTSRAAAIVSG